MDIETMKALCEPSRCRIVSLLSQRAYCVSALATMLDLSAPAVSQHLRVLRDAGIVYCEKYGYHTHYLLDKEKIAQIADSILDLTRENRTTATNGDPTVKRQRLSAARPAVKTRNKERKAPCSNDLLLTTSLISICLPWICWQR